MDPQNPPLTPLNQLNSSSSASAPPPLPSPSPAPASAMPSEEQMNPLPAPQGTTPPAASAKQLATERIKSATNVLITVGANPSVDALTSALGLTFLLDKLGKHATTVFSGEVPRAIEFLDPEATIEDSVDSLRDFIIALDKEKADKLRYKVEEDVVRIFITPYKTTLSEKDLQFSQGDFNVDVVVALGVTKREDLDRAITAHGRILHDATIITINASDEKSSLGAIDWEEPNASSIAEMLVGISESFGPNLIDEQTSTAFLTGIVAATNRFSNEKTTPKVMTISAQLMAAGANQQLIASNLRQDGTLTDSIHDAGEGHEQTSEMVVEHDKTEKKSEKSSKKSKEKKPPLDLEKAATKSEANKKDVQEESLPEAELKPDLTPTPESEAPQKLELADDLKKQLMESEPAVSTQASNLEPSAPDSTSITDIKTGSAADEPTMPTQPVEPDNDEPAFNATMAQVEADQKTQVDSEQANNTNQEPSGEAAQDDALEAARKAVESAADSAPFDPANKPIQSLNAQQLPEVEHTSTDAKPVESTLDLPPLPTSSGIPGGAPLDSASSQSSDEPQPVDQPLPSIDLPHSPMISSPEPQQELDSAASAQQSLQSTTFGLDESKKDEENSTPMDAFMSSHSAPNLTPSSSSLAPMASEQTSVASNALPSLPPLPPLPNDSAAGALPPMPPLPGSEPTTPQLQPQTTPEFMQNLPTSQNQWTQAADEVAQKQQAATEQREQKMNEMTQQYDAAVDKNRELQGQPPLNPPANDHTTFPLPPPPPA